MVRQRQQNQPKAGRTIRSSTGDRIYYALNLLILIIIGLIVFYPIYFVIIASISEPDAVNSGRVAFLPAGVTMEGYAKLFEDQRVWLGYAELIKYGAIVFASLPVLLITPFVQKYFEKGVMIGAVKG